MYGATGSNLKFTRIAIPFLAKCNYTEGFVASDQISKHSSGNYGLLSHSPIQQERALSCISCCTRRCHCASRV